MATFVNPLRLTELATGEGSGTWGTTTNTNLELIGEALGYGTQDCFASDADATTTIADGAVDPARALYFKVTSSATLTATRTLTIAPNTINRVMWVENATTGSQSITISQGSGTTVTVGAGKVKAIYLDGGGTGANVAEVLDGAQLPNLQLGTDATVSAILDEDDMSSDSDTALATQQSIKAYVDNSGVDLTAVTTDIKPNTDNANDLGSSTKRWKDLYLSGGLYIGGTTSANFLDDYEEGTWTPNGTPPQGQDVDGTVTARYGFYRKVGTVVHVFLYLKGSNLGVSASTGGASLQLAFYSGLPFFQISVSGDSVNSQGVYSNRLGLSQEAYQPCLFMVDSNFVLLYNSNGQTFTSGITANAFYFSTT